MDFIARLAARVPKPRVNLTRFHGVLAPNHRWRGEITPARRGTADQSTTCDSASFSREGAREFTAQPAGTPLNDSWHRFLCASVRKWMENICGGTYTSAISRRLRMIELHHRVKDLGGASGFFPSTPFILLILHEKYLTAEG